MTDYSGDHASAYADLLEAGTSVTFTQIRAESYDAATDIASLFTATVLGAAVRVKGDPQRYAALNLTESEALTLLFAPATYGERPPLGASVQFGGAVYTVKSIAPVAPDGSDIIARIICAGGGIPLFSEHIASETSDVTATETDETQA